MITFENVKKRYGDYIFDIQSMNIQQGMITGLIGMVLGRVLLSALY